MEPKHSPLGEKGTPIQNVRDDAHRRRAIWVWLQLNLTPKRYHSKKQTSKSYNDVNDHKDFFKTIKLQSISSNESGHQRSMLLACHPKQYVDC